MVNTLRYNTMTFHDLTVVMVPKQFYNSRIFVNSFFLRGPGWNANFIPKGSLVQVALHHDLCLLPRAPRACVVLPAGASRGGRSALARVPRSTGANKDQRATCIGSTESYRHSEERFRRVEVKHRGDGRKPEKDTSVGRRRERCPADRHRRRGDQYRRTLGFAGADPGSRRASQGARRTTILGGVEQADEGGMEEARSGRRGETETVRRNHETRFWPVGPTVIAKWPVCHHPEATGCVRVGLCLQGA